MSYKLVHGIAAAAIAITMLVTTKAQAETVTDVLGREVEVPDRVERVLLGFYFEDFLAIVGPDAYERVVAISKDTWEGWRNLQWKAYSKTIPRILELTDIGEFEAGTFSIETAVATKPDVAILAAWQFKMMGDAASKFEAAGIPVVVVDYNAQTVEKHVSSTHIIGKVMDSEARATQLAEEYEAAVADVRARVASSKEPIKRVYVEIGNKDPDTMGNSYGEKMWGGVIAMAGGDNIALGQVSNWGPLSPEYVLGKNPQVIFFGGSGWAGRDRAIVMGPGVDASFTYERMRPFTQRVGWSGLAAVETGDVYALYHGGARTLYDYAFLQYVAKVLHPDAFADVDPQETLKRFFATYLPIPADGTYMTQLPR
ncbi:iron ABC transporter substrate-binding protein [Hwanghaeella grinnelliae]|uniref:Iron ABC transporter substrate-binding protein n=1 Tax=Hwanghaeella grinnelliae TaxID=2500179 RepID=A0A3S2VML4_9PROT|nr:ABC transporter substrate-binding protein [Hwanghaeella grinnelliae]RVU34066.1 iron ABC transporter substrate-binding protein [Hwanghaeella grinnelliae]